jgi:thiol-disulfide isomerase/thioredoxin
MRHFIVVILFLSVYLDIQAQKKKITVQGKVSLMDQKKFGSDGQLIVINGPVWQDTLVYINIKSDGSFKVTVPDSTVAYLFYFIYPGYRLELVQVYPELGDWHFDIGLMPGNGSQQFYDGEHIQWKSNQRAAQAALYNASRHVSDFEVTMQNTLIAAVASEESRRNFSGVDIQSELEEVEARISQATDALLKQIYLLEYLCIDASQQKVRRRTKANADTSNRSLFKGDGKMELLDQVFQWVKPGTAFWNIESGGNGVSWLFKKIAITDEKLAYADRMINEQQGRHIAASVLYGLASQYNRTNERGSFAKVYNQLVTEYPGINSTNKAKQEFKLLANMQVGNQVPGFSISSYDQTVGKISSETMKGKVYLIDFWAPWCKGCIMALPGLERIYKKYHKKGLEMVSVLFDGNAEWLQKFREERYKMPWLHGYDPQGFKSDIAMKFEVSSVPRLMLIGADGKILAVDPGKEQLDNILSDLF